SNYENNTIGDTEILENILDSETVTDTVVNDMLGGTKNSIVSLNTNIFTNKLNIDTDTDTIIGNILHGYEEHEKINNNYY
ncbi:MAG: hypothetical protein JKZ03_08000, partial [Flavobacteriaceae bacterium]|nr:hypothetical protein [Flavobacteriaceae bacterium]